MRHRLAHRKLGRTTPHRLSLLRNLTASLILHERIYTTLAKAKELRPFAEKLVTLGKRDSLHARRRALSILPRRQVVKKLFDEISPRFADRSGGYTRILKLAPRWGDGAAMAFIEFVDYRFEGAESKPVSGKPDKAPKAKKKEKPEEPVEAEAAAEPEAPEEPSKSAKPSKTSRKEATPKKGKEAKPTARKKAAKKATKKKRT